MEGVHDLGGMQGFGPIEVDHENHVVLKHWEDRMWAVSRNTGAADWTVDWWRHITERLPPEVYLNIPYFEKWMLTYATGFVTSGLFTVEEIISGHTTQKDRPPPARNVPDTLELIRTGNSSTREAVEKPPVFASGQQVRTLTDVPADHTRLPRYARGRTGTILAHHGAYVFPDLNARGIREHDHLYTVIFSAHSLWGESAAEHDTVRLDLWERYFVQT